MKFEEKYKKWISSSVLSKEEKEEIFLLSKKEKEDRFYTDLAFGTGGLRGVMEIGENCMNLYTVRRAAEGVARELLASSEADAARGVVIGFDSRKCSAIYARASAEVISSFGITAYLFDRLCPTPEISFAVRHLGCARGIVITASHNPKEYNGFKVYDGEGTQITPVLAERILSFMQKIPLPECSFGAPDPARIFSLSSEIEDRYIEAVLEERLGISIPKGLRVLYTPLHGAGNIPVRRVLSALGAEVSVVEAQEAPNGDFPTVKSPNPENREAFDLAIAYAKAHPADIILGTDPDSDRLGLVIPARNGEFIVLNGNQTGALLAELILRKMSENGLPKDSRIVKTIVTTELVRKIGAHYGVETEDVLTGFKYIGDKIKEYESRDATFLFGLEESYGYLKGTYARDKDAVVAAMLATELCADCKAAGITVEDRLHEIYEKYGYHKEQLLSYTLLGLDGSKRIAALMEALRGTPPLAKETERIDYREGIGDLPKADVLKLFFSDGWLAVRPSGTEPKIKFYLAANGESEAACDQILASESAFVARVISKYK